MDGRCYSFDRNRLVGDTINPDCGSRFRMLMSATNRREIFEA